MVLDGSVLAPAASFTMEIAPPVLQNLLGQNSLRALALAGRCTQTVPPPPQ